MPLRNGKSYLKNYMCQKCNSFYSHKDYNYKCSACFLGKKSSYYAKIQFGKNCDQWVKENTVNKNKTILMLKKVAKKPRLLMKVLSQLKSRSQLITAELGLELWNSNPVKENEMICLFIADWWNIRSDFRSSWPNYLTCYYGNFNEPLSDLWSLKATVPPKKIH